VRASEQVLGATVKKHGIRSIEFLRKPFDPNRHEVVADVESENLPPGAVGDVLQPGYTHHRRLLRPAMANIAKKASNNPEYRHQHALTLQTTLRAVPEKSPSNTL
jgi:molecular chaperone GrpE